MSKEATSRPTSAPAKPTGKLAGAAMQRYLKYLKSDSKPLSEEEQRTIRVELGIWRGDQTS